MTPKVISFLLGLAGLIALGIVSFWLLKLRMRCGRARTGATTRS
jgi:hypothetical protein